MTGITIIPVIKSLTDIGFGENECRLIYHRNEAKNLLIVYKRLREMFNDSIIVHISDTYFSEKCLDISIYTRKQYQCHQCIEQVHDLSLLIDNYKIKLIFNTCEKEVWSSNHIPYGGYIGVSV